MAGIRRTNPEALYDTTINGHVVWTDIDLKGHNLSLLKGELDPRKSQASQFIKPWASWKAHVHNANEYYYLQGLGLWHHSRWKYLLGDQVLSCQKTLTQWLVENNQPGSLRRWLMTWDEPCKFFASREYRALVGRSIGSGQTYGSQLCKPKNSGRKRTASTARIAPILQEYNITLLEDYTGALLSSEPKVLKPYRVRCNVCNEEFITEFGNSTIRRCPACVTHRFQSHREALVAQYLKSKGIKLYQNYRRLLRSDKAPLEVDIYLTEQSIALEFNGYYFHHSGEHGKAKDYHRLKTQQALDLGIKLYHFWEDESDELVLGQVDRILQGEVISTILVDKNPELLPISQPHLRCYYTLRASPQRKAHQVVEDLSTPHAVPIYDAGIVKM